MNIQYITDPDSDSSSDGELEPGVIRGTQTITGKVDQRKSLDHEGLTLRLQCHKCGATSKSVFSTHKNATGTNDDSNSSCSSDSEEHDESRSNSKGSKPTTPVHKKPATRIGRYVKQKDKEKFLVDEADWKPPDSLSDNGKFAIVVEDKVTFDWYGNETSRTQELTLVSPLLVKAFVSIVEYYPGVSLEGNEIVLTGPYAPLFFYYDDLSRLSEDDSRPGLSTDFKVLADFYTRWIKQGHDNIRQRLKNKLVLFEDLWAVFRPGDLVYTLDEFDEPTLHFLGATEYRKPENGGQESYSIRRFKRFSADLWSVTWDKAGGMFQRITLTRSIRIYSEARQITSLPFYPLKYYSDGNDENITALLHLLQGRGNKWRELVARKPSCWFYDGPATHFSAFRDSERLSERVMVDASATKALMGNVPEASQQKERHGLIGGSGTKHQNIEYEWHVHGAGMHSELGNFDDFPRDGVFSDLQAQLCPSSVVCYGLKSSKWYQLPVSKLTSVQWVSESLKSLVIDPDTKDMLVGLVQQHRKSLDGGLGDIIESKGKGLIVVLYGNPGVGKTLTAETVAEFTEKPLYPLNIGQLTSQPQMVEDLGMHFGRASRWDAVLLLDEADVLLEKRSYENLHRNGIVSVFLRMLEYYEGIIFLTTNRLLTMDSAFESRIQLAIRLPDLSVSSRRQIWKNLINRLNPEEAFGKQELMDHLDELEKWELNGRQIRNVLSTAETFALGTQHRRGALRFRMVQNMANEVIRFHDFFEDGAHERKAQLGVINPRQFQERRRF